MGERSYREKIVLIGCMLCIVGIIPYAIYRYVNGEYLLAFIESLLAVATLGLFLFVWRTHKYQTPALIMSVISVAVIIAVVHIKGPSLVYWMYPTIIFCYYVLNARAASIITLVSMFLLFPALYSTLETQETVTIYLTLAMLGLFGYSYILMSFQQHAELAKLAARDSLTGVWNRRSLDEALTQLFNKHQRKPITASLIIMDLDHFKQINDTYGHSVGDEILIKIAELLTSVVRISDQVYRYGGEEFVLIAEGADLEGASEIAETIRSRVEASQLFKKQKVTLSLGVAELSQASSAQRWLSLADDALYDAKNKGRNQFCLSPHVVEIKAAA